MGGASPLKFDGAQNDFSVSSRLENNEMVEDSKRTVPSAITRNIGQGTELQSGVHGINPDTEPATDSSSCDLDSNVAAILALQDDSGEDDCFRIESKCFILSIRSASLHISQTKGFCSRAISFDLEGASWLYNSSLQIQTGASNSWAFTRYENYRELNISFDFNWFGGFLRLVETRDGARTTLIIPEGRGKAGLYRFAHGVAKQILKLKDTHKQFKESFSLVSNLVLECDPCIVSAAKFDGNLPNMSISQCLFHKDLLDLGVSFADQERYSQETQSDTLKDFTQVEQFSLGSFASPSKEGKVVQTSGSGTFISLPMDGETSSSTSSAPTKKATSIPSVSSHRKYIPLTDEQKEKFFADMLEADARKKNMGRSCS